MTGALRYNTIRRWGIVILTGAVCVLDILTPAGWAVPILYLIPLALSYDLPRRRLHLELSAVYTALILIGWYGSPVGIDTVGATFNRLLMIGMTWISALAMVNRKQLREQATSAVVGREQAERQLAESERRFSQLVSEVRDYSILMLGPAGRVESWNAGAERMTGYRAEEVIGSHFSRFYRPEEIAVGHPESLLAQAARNGRVEDEGWRVRKDGTQFFADVVITALRNPDGLVTGYAKIVRDVTERNRLQEQFRLAVEASPSGMLLTDEQGRIKLVNAQIENMFGYHREDLIDQTVEILVPDALREVHQGERHAFMRMPEAREVGRGRELSGRKQDGTVLPLEVSLNPIRTVSGLRILAAVVDISERRRAEAERRALDERLRSILNSMEEVVWSSSLDLTQIYYISSSVTRVYGRRPDEFLNQPMLWLKAIHDEDQAMAMKAADDLQRTGHFDAQYRIVRPDGTVRWLHDRGRTIKDEQGQPLRIDGVAADITERREAETALRESEVRFRTTLDSMLEGCQIIGFDWRYLYVNEAAARHGRKSLAELLGRTVMEVYPGIESTELFDKLRDGMTTRTTMMHDAEFVYPDGSKGVFDVKIQPVPEGIFVLSNDITERKRVQDALQESRERLELFIKHAPAALAMFDRDMRYVAVSQRWLADYSLEDAQIVGRAHYDIFPDIAEEWKAAHQRAMRGEIVRKDEDRFERSNGVVYWVRWEVRPWHLADGDIGGIVILSEDITSRKRAELALAQLNAELEERVRVRTQELSSVNQELRESSRRFRAIFNSTFQFTALLSTDGVLLEVNQSALEFAGAPTSTVLGRSFWETPWWAHSSHEQQRLRDAIQSAGEGDFVRFETTHRSYEGRLAAIDFSVKPILDENRTVVLLVAEGRDITERKRAEEAVERAKRDLDLRVHERTAELSRVNSRLAREVAERRTAEERLSQVVELAPSGMVLVDRAGTIRLINRRIEEQFGYQRDELIGQSVDRLLPASSRAQHTTDRDHYLKKPETRPMGQGRELYGLRKDGSEFPLEIGLSPVETPEGGGVLASVVDITERKRLHAQLRRTERIAELGTLASGMAHEIGTPMNVILGRAEYLLQRTNDEGLKKGLGTIVTQVERITKVMNQLLAFARRRTPERRLVDLRATIEDSLEMFQERLHRKQITVERQMDSQLPLVKADPDQMTQVMINLFMNSVHAMPDGGTLRVHLGRTNRHVTVEVSDTGHGMSPEVLGKIFDPFFTTKDTGEGTGLGLTVVKGIIEEHDGTISVASEIDKGTTVTVSLPIDNNVA